MKGEGIMGCCRLMQYEHADVTEKMKCTKQRSSPRLSLLESQPPLGRSNSILS